MNKEEKFFEEIECEHGYRDHEGFARCSMGSELADDTLECYCTEEACYINEMEPTNEK